MTYETFDEIAALGTTNQREVLQRGEPLERIWAAWALGLQLGRIAAPDLVQGLQSSPSPGTRRHLIVVLAGLSERAALVVLAEHDPDEFVRATACQYLGRVALPGDRQVAVFLRSRLSDDRSLEVRQTILMLALDRLLPLSLVETTCYLASPVRAIRQLAIAILRVTYSTDQLYPGPLETHIVREPDSDLRAEVLAECITVGNVVRLLHLAERSDDDLRLEVLHALGRAGQRFSWGQIASLASLEQPTIDVILLDLLRPDELGYAFGWLLSCAARSITWPQPQNSEAWRLADVVWQCGVKSEKFLLLALSASSLPRTPQIQDHLGILIAHLEDWERLANLPHDEWEEDDGSWHFDEETRREQLDLLSALRAYQHSFS